MSAHVEEHPGETPAEMKEVFNVSTACIASALRKMLITRKKTTYYRERDDLVRCFFVRHLNDLIATCHVYFNVD